MVVRRFILVALVFLLLGFSLGAEKKTPPVGPIPVTPISQLLYFAVASENPGSVYVLNLTTKDISVLYTRPAGRLSSFAFHPEIPEKLYFVNGNGNKIFRVLWLRDHWSGEEVVYEHSAYVRDIAFGPEPVTGTPTPAPRLALFFSEATGAGGGKIYYIRGNRPVLYYWVTVPWAGDFAFDEEGNLYLSSGNRVPAKIYKVVDGTLHTIYGRNEPIKGFVVRGGKIYFANWRGSIYVLDLASGEVEEILGNPRRFKWLSDVNFRG